MHREFKPVISTYSAAEARQRKFEDSVAQKSPPNVQAQSYMNQDINEMRKDEKLEHFSDHWRIDVVPPRGNFQVMKRVTNEQDGVKIIFFEPVNMSLETIVAKFKSQGEVWVDDCKIDLVRDDRLLRAVVYEGKLPSYLAGLVEGRFSNSQRLAEALVDAIRHHYAEERAPAPEPTPKTVAQALKARKYDLAEDLLSTELQNLYNYARGFSTLTDVQINDIKENIKRCHKSKGFRNRMAWKLKEASA